ncbi:hypothetical protein D9756_009038 [Leucocoprinus leucothites]|nr:hypothetical protein D9756_009038 [Leucoagaricus leucothites]
MQWKRQKQRQKQRQRQSEKQRRKRDLMESASSDYNDDVEAQMYEEGARDEKEEMMDQDDFGNVSLSTEKRSGEINARREIK